KPASTDAASLGLASGLLASSPVSTAPDSTGDTTSAVASLPPSGASFVEDRPPPHPCASAAIDASKLEARSQYLVCMAPTSPGEEVYRPVVRARKRRGRVHSSRYWAPTILAS